MESRSLLRFAAFFAVMVLSAALYDAEALAARTPEDCHQMCGPEVDCEEPCMFVPEPPFEAFEITCGEFEGGGSQGYCLGECGDDFCNGYAGEEYGECEDDCGYCGDGKCQRQYEASGSGYCENDCGSNSVGADECDPQTGNSCSTGDMCNSNEQCVPIEEPCANPPRADCRNNSDCCNDQHCFIDCAAYPWMCDYGAGPTGVCLPANLTAR